MEANSGGEVEEKKTHWALKAGGFILLLLVAVLAKGIGREVGKSTVENFHQGQQDGALEEGMQKAAAQIRSQTPIKVDDVTTMVDAVAIGKTMTYQMSLNTDLPEAAIPEAQSEMQATVSQNVCQNEKTKKLIEAGATMTYNYVLPSGRTFQASVDHCT